MKCPKKSKKQKARPDPKRNLQWKERLGKIIVILSKILLN
jgi:hypothetical protein